MGYLRIRRFRQALAELQEYVRLVRYQLYQRSGDRMARRLCHHIRHTHRSLDSAYQKARHARQGRLPRRLQLRAAARNGSRSAHSLHRIPRRQLVQPVPLFQILGGDRDEQKDRKALSDHYGQRVPYLHHRLRHLVLSAA